jgi:hypothetical protein
VLDSACTSYMTEEKEMFTSFKKNDCLSDTIMFGDNSEEMVFEYGKIAITTDHSISIVLLDDSLDYNLLFVSQLFEMGYNYLFTNKGVTIFRSCDGSYAFSDILKGKLYCHTRFLCQNQLLIICMTQDQLFHTYGQKCL